MELQRTCSLRGKECTPAGRLYRRDEMGRARCRASDFAFLRCGRCHGRVREHDILAAVLLGHVSRRLDFRDFVTRMDVSGRLDGKYEKDVADELRHRYSDRM